jgi:hypothetical protein
VDGVKPAGTVSRGEEGVKQGRGGDSAAAGAGPRTERPEANAAENPPIQTGPTGFTGMPAGLPPKRSTPRLFGSTRNSFRYTKNSFRYTVISFWYTGRPFWCNKKYFWYTKNYIRSTKNFFRYTENSFGYTENSFRYT